MKRAHIQHEVLIKLEPKRGIIYDNMNRILALNIPKYSIYAVPPDIKDKVHIATRLSSVLNLRKDYLFDRLNREKSFVWIKRKISDEELTALKKANLDGIGWIKETERSYPKDKLGCHFLGFVDIDNNGLEGVELYYDKFLRGKYGWRNVLRDAKQKFLYTYGEDLPPLDGYNLILTVDEVIQHIVESEIVNIVNKFKPGAVSIVAMDPSSGAILAMANYPNFNPNYYKKANKTYFKNRCITDTFEPGSVFKIVTASAVLEENLVDFDERFDCENGLYKIGKRVLHDYRPYKVLTFREVIEKSSNIGTAKVASKLGKDKLYDYIKKFGFGMRSGIDLNGEENGILRHVKGWSYVDMTTIPIGQGISCTALQLVNAISAIGNGGRLMKPYIVKSIVDEDGNIVKNSSPTLIRDVLSEEAVFKMKQLLFGVIERGTGKMAKLDGYTAGGKTGTAQKVADNGRYSEDKFAASFIGFAPLEEPRIALAVCVDEPKGQHFGGTVGAPAFRNIMQKALRYLEIPQELESKSTGAL